MRVERAQPSLSLFFLDNPRSKLAGLLVPKTGPRPRDCRDYAAVTHVERAPRFVCHAQIQALSGITASTYRVREGMSRRLDGILVPAT